MTTPAPMTFYNELAEWWPLISPVEDYKEEAEYTRTLIDSASIPVRQVLELGSGGGHNAAYLKAHYELTLVDLAKDMLSMSRKLNPECEHLVGDMRTVRLERSFDAVFIHDAIDYMVTEPDLSAAIKTAYIHCRPGGIAVIAPDDLKETFESTTEHGGSESEDGRAVRYLEWSWDPDPQDTSVLTEYAFLLRTEDHQVRHVHERHETGLFFEQDWCRHLQEAGFNAQVLTEVTTEDRTPRRIFLGRRDR